MGSLERTLAVLAVGAAVLGAPGPAAAEPPTGGQAEDDADRLFRAGKKAFAEGKLEEALEAYRSAWTRKKAYYIAANLGQVELELGQHLAAARHLAHALSTTIPPEVRIAVEAALLEAKKHVAALKISAEQDGVEIWVDGASVGKSPLRVEVFVEPGTHSVRARRGGIESAPVEVNVERGLSRQVELGPVSEVREPPVDSPPTDDEPAAGVSGLAVASIVTGGLSLASVGLGVGFAARASSAESDRNRLRRDLGFDSETNARSDVCGDSSAGECLRLTELDKRSIDSRKVEVAGFAAAGGFATVALVTGIMALAKRSDRAKSARNTGFQDVVPWVAPRSLGLSVGGSF